MIAGYIVTASLSALEAFHYVSHYLHLTHEQVVRLTLIALDDVADQREFPLRATR